ncbi:MAG: cell surface protein SprA [Gemmatimonadaceae bacterium]|nr:cell surface protein SprA [Gemmatimonadaceae bacterium]
MKYTARRRLSGTRATRSASSSTMLRAVSAVLLLAISATLAAKPAAAQVGTDTTVKTQPTQPATPPTGTPGVPGLRIRLGRDTLPFRLPAIESRTERESYRQAAAQIEAARATAFQQNMRTILESVWGQVATTTFATSQAAPSFPGELPPKAKPSVPVKAVPIIGDYSDIGLQLDSRLEFRGEKNQSKRCSSGLFFDPVASCHSAFEPLVDFQFSAKSGGIVADRIHVDLDYDTQREFDASNNISIYYEGKGEEVLQRLEIGNVTFQPPASRFITTGIPSGNYGLQAITKIGAMRLKTIVAQQKGNVVRDRVFTVGDRTLQALDRKIEDYQFEARRFFFTVHPKLFGKAYPNVDILDTRRMARLSASLPDSLRPTRIFLYRLLIGGQPPNPNGPQFRLIGDPRSRRGQVYEYLREGVDYYADPSLLWIALVRPLALNNERLVVAYRVRINGRDTILASTGGTPDLSFTPGRDQVANLIWDPTVKPGDPAFDREIRSVYRLGGSDVRRQSVTLKVVTGSSSDQEKPLSGSADTYLQLFGLSQPTNTSSFDVENRIWPRPGDPNFELSLGASGAKTIRDQFLVFPSAKPFASIGLVGAGNPTNDTIYTTPPEYVRSSQRPEAVYHIRVRYQAEGSGEGGTLMLGTVQVRPSSERLLVDGTPLVRGADYTVDYDLGRVAFSRPDTLFPRPRQVTVQYEENPLFEETPTSIFGATGEFQMTNGQLAFTAISQNQKSNFTRPALGFEPQSMLVAGVTGLFSFDAPQLTALVSRLPAGETTAPSRVGLSAEFAASRPRTGAAQQAYIESFEGEAGLFIPLSDQQWYYSSQPALGRQLASRFGGGVFDLSRAATLAWQSNGADASGKVVKYSIEQIDTLTSLTGTGISGPEPLLWMTLYPASVGGLFDNATGTFRWRLGNATIGRRWRSIRTVLSSSGTDISRAENLEFWAQVVVSPSKRAKNPVMVFDFGDVSENSVSFAPDTLAIGKGGAPSLPDSLYFGRHLAGYDRLDSERDPFSRAFNVGANDNGLPGDVVDSLLVVGETTGARAPFVAKNVATCAGGFRVLQILGDSKVDCTITNNHLDEEDIDADNVLNFTSADRDQETWKRYIVDLADPAKYTRMGKCSVAPTLLAGRTAPDSVCWVLFRVPFKAADDSLGQVLLRRAHALRITMISGTGLGADDFSTVPLARLRLTGAPWLKLNDHALRGIAGDQPGVGIVQAGVIGTQDRNLTSGVSYESPPGVSDAPTSKTVSLQTGRVQINERSLRLTATALQPLERAEAYYRFPEGEKNFMGYTEVRVWARGIRDGWGDQGELQFYIRLGRDVNNFYMYRTPLNGGEGKSAWLPEVRVDFNKLFALRAQIQNAYLRGKAPNTCKGIDSVLIASSPIPPGHDPSGRYAACADGYIVYSLDPGTSPPNLAAVQEMAVGMVRTRAGGSIRPVLPSDTLELWVDDIRLGGSVNQTGFAGQLGLAVVVSDFADIRINATKRDPHFHQLAEQATFLTDNSLNISSAFHLEKLLPLSLGIAVPLTVNYTGASSDPLFISQSDLQGDVIEGLRRPRSAATSITLGIRRTRQSSGSALGVILDNLSLSSAYTRGVSRSEYEEGRAHNLIVGLDFNLSRALVPEASRWIPAEMHLTTAYTNGLDNRTSYLKPSFASFDPARKVRGRSQTWRNGSSVVFHPFKSAALRWDISSVRDLRNYGDQSVLGVVTTSERDRLLGATTGLERERAMQAGINISPPITAWFRPRLDFGTTYNMLRDPNTLSFLRAPDSVGSYRLPRRLGNTQTMTAGLTLDLPRAARQYLDSGSLLQNALLGLQPVDVNLNRSLLSVFDGTPMQPSLGYQFALGGVGKFRSLGSDLATSAGIVTQLSLNHSIRFPFGISVANRYQRINTRNWTRRFDERQEIVDGTQVVFPDVALRWSGRPMRLQSVISSLGLTARFLETRQLNATEPLGGDQVTDLGKIRVRSYPLNASLVFTGGRPVSTSVGLNVAQHRDSRPGLASSGRTADFSADLGKPWGLPAHWNLKSDLRTRLGYQRSQGANFVANPLDITGRSRLTDNGRRAFSFNADTDVSENLSSSFVVSRVESFDRNLNRGFTQTVISAVLHMQFYAGEFK